jgi:hypothetical protein
VKHPVLTNRSFGISLAVVLSFIGLVGWLFFDYQSWGLFGWAAFFLVAAIAFPFILMPLNRLWGRFAFRLGRITNTLILGFIFYVVITPISLLFKLLGRDSMNRCLDSDAETYLTPVNRQDDEETYQDLF